MVNFVQLLWKQWVSIRSLDQIILLVKIIGNSVQLLWKQWVIIGYYCKYSWKKLSSWCDKFKSNK